MRKFFLHRVSVLLNRYLRTRRHCEEALADEAIQMSKKVFKPGSKPGSTPMGHDGLGKILRPHSLRSLAMTGALNNERGVAALVSIILAIIILGSVAFNFIAETRQKQSGSALTYTSTNAFMIAEAGLRYTQKCMVDSAPGVENWGCPAALYENDDWTTGITIPGTIVPSTSFGDGNFTVDTISDGDNDENNIKVISTGTFRGATRTLTRIISRICTPVEPPDDGADFCTSYNDKNNASIDPPLPDPPVASECDPDGMVNVPDLDSNYDPDCNCSPSFPCPDFDPNNHLLAGNFLDPNVGEASDLDTDRMVFCNFKLDDNEIVNTSITNDQSILVIKDFQIKDNAELRLKNDGPVDDVFTVSTGTDRINITGHSYSVDDEVNVSSKDTLPAGLSTSTTYYVINTTANDFQLSLTASPGSAVDITDTGTDTHRIRAADDTSIIVYDDVTLKNNGVIRVRGTLAMLVADNFTMLNSSKLNQNQGTAANVLVMSEDDALIKNNAFFSGWLVSDGKINLKNNAEIQGAISGNEISLKNNATVVYTGNEDAGSNSSGASVATQCGTSVAPDWS